MEDPAMWTRNTVKLPSGYLMPRNALGTWRSTDEPLKAAVKCALDVGIRHFDTARLYFNEKVIGEVLSSAITTGEVKREELFIVSKVSRDCIVYTDKGCVRAFDSIVTVSTGNLFKTRSCQSI